MKQQAPLREEQVMTTRSSKNSGCARGCLLDVAIVAVFSVMGLLLILWLPRPIPLQTPPPDDQIWWVLCVSPRELHKVQNAHLVDWRQVFKGGDEVTTWDSKAPLRVDQLRPIRTEEEHDAVFDAVRELRDRFSRSVGYTSLKWETVGDDTLRLHVSIDDEGDWTTLYSVSEEGEVHVLAVGHAGWPFYRYGYRLPHDLVLTAGPVAGVVLVTLRRIIVQARRNARRSD